MRPSCPARARINEAREIMSRSRRVKLVNYQTRRSVLVSPKTASRVPAVHPAAGRRMTAAS